MTLIKILFLICAVLMSVIGVLACRNFFHLDVGTEADNLPLGAGIPTSRVVIVSVLSMIAVTICLYGAVSL